MPASYEGSRSVIGSREGGGSLGFGFLLSLSGIAWSCCYSRNAFDVGDTHAVVTEIWEGKNPMTYKLLWQLGHLLAKPLKIGTKG